MFKKYLISLFLVTLICSVTFSQDDSKGSITAQIDGNSFRSAIKSIATETSYEINGGNENEGIKIFWNNISSEKQVKTGTFKFPGEENMQIAYVDYKSGMPMVIKEGSITVTENDGKKISGTFEMILFSGLPSELGGKDVKVTDGKFIINY